MGLADRRFCEHAAKILFRKYAAQCDVSDFNGVTFSELPKLKMILKLMLQCVMSWK